MTPIRSYPRSTASLCRKAASGGSNSSTASLCRKAASSTASLCRKAASSTAKGTTPNRLGVVPNDENTSESSQTLYVEFE